jgi:hypothetical protein
LSDAKSSKQQLMAADQAEARQLVALQQRLAAVLVEQEKVRRHGVALCHHPLTNKKKKAARPGIVFLRNRSHAAFHASCPLHSQHLPHGCFAGGCGGGFQCGRGSERHHGVPEAEH